MNQFMTTTAFAHAWETPTATPEELALKKHQEWAAKHAAFLNDYNRDVQENGILMAEESPY